MRPLLNLTSIGLGASLLMGSLSCGRPYSVDPETLIARAAAERRELELRLPGEPYAKLVSTRSGASHRNESVELAEAEAILLRQVRTDVPAPRIHRLHSRVHLLRARWNEAVASAQLAQEAETGSEVDLANAYLGRALAQHNPRDLQFAIEYFGEVLAANPAEVVALFNRALALELLFLYDRAQVDCEAFLAIDGTSGWAAESRERLARLRQKTQHGRQVLPLYGSRENSYSDLSDRIPPEVLLETAIIAWMPAMVNSDGQRSGQARKALTRLAADLSSGHGDRWLLEMLSRNPVARAWTALAGAVEAGQSGRRDTALRLSIEARRLFEQHSIFSGAARARMEQIYALSRSFRASDCLREADSLSRDLKGKSYVWIAGQLAIERSVCTFHMGKFDAALDGIAAALDTLSAARLDTLRLRALGVQSSFYRILGDGPRTLRTGCNGLQVFWDGFHPPSRAYHFLGEMFLNAEREGCWRSAQMFAREAVDRIALGQNRLTEASARARLASISLRLGDHQEAVRQGELAARFFAEFRNDRSHREFELTNALALAEAHLAGGQVQEARRALAEFAAGDEGQTIYSRLALRRVRGLIHDRSGDWTGARAELMEAAEIAETSTRNLASAASRLRWKQEAGPAFRTLARIILEHENPEQALALWEWFRSAPIRQQMLPGLGSAAVAFKDAAARYSETTLVSWVEMEGRIGIWLSDDRGVRFAWSPVSVSQCRRASAEFYRLCSRPTSDLHRLRAVASDLYGMLFGPVAQWLDPGRVLLLEPDGVPGAIPFEALVRPRGKWLGEEFTIITSPGMWAELALRPLQRPIGKDTHAVIVGNPIHLSDDVLPPLPDVEREAQHVATLLPSNRSFLGVEATPMAIRAALLDADVFHFAGHARFDGESARLLLSGQRALMDAEAIETASRRCKLAVLSACSTAASEIQGPWNVDSLVQAFWRAGAPHVVASRWDVESSATAQLFREFYLHLLRGETVAGALALANSALRLRSETAHPYFWSAFGLFGCAPESRGGRPKSRL